MSFGTHAYVPDERNSSVLFNLNGVLVPRDKAVVNVFDSGFMLGDGVWEGLRVHQGRIAFLGDHLDRLWEGAAALHIDIGITRDELTDRLYETLKANDMTKGVHIRLMLTRGLRSTPYQDPRVVISKPTIVIAPEFKTADPAIAARAQRLYTVSVRRGRADVQDPGLNSHSKINCVTACIQAIQAGADEGLMLDRKGLLRRVIRPISLLSERAKFGRLRVIIVWVVLRGVRLSICVERMASLSMSGISRWQNVTAPMKPSPRELSQDWRLLARLMAVKSEMESAGRWLSVCSLFILISFMKTPLHDNCHVVGAEKFVHGDDAKLWRAR